MQATGRRHRHLVITDPAGTLLGPLCLKRHGPGMSSDNDVPAPAREVASGQMPTGLLRKDRGSAALGAAIRELTDPR
jgi:hypothetical protein